MNRKQKHEAAVARREQFLAEEKQRGAESLRKHREAEEYRKTHKFQPAPVNIFSQIHNAPVRKDES